MTHTFKHLIFTSLLAMASATAWADVTPEVPAVGDGSEAHPYELSTPSHMSWLMDNYSNNTTNSTSGLRLDQSHYVLTADIDLAEIEWSMLRGPYVAGIQQGFSGSFDGRGHTISHLHGSGNENALFYTTDECLFQNLTLADVNFSGTGSYGSFVYSGDSNNRTATAVFRNVHVSGTISTSSTSGRCGGFYSTCYSAEFYNCSNAAVINITNANGSFAGGFVAQQYDGANPLVLDGCVNTGAITGEGYLGGIVGSVIYCNITNCLNLADITGRAGAYNVGGIVGTAGGKDGTAYVSSCLNLGNVSGGYDCSRIIGKATGNVILTACLWDTSKTLTCNSNNGHPYCGGGAVTAQYCVGVSPEQLASGYAAFLLQGKQVGTRWGQNLASSAAYPRPGANSQVYLAGGYIDCGGTQHGGSYSNTPSTVDIRDHEWHDGICSGCGTVTAPGLVDGYYEIANVGHLLWLRDYVNVGHGQSVKARQTADLDLSSVCGEGVGDWIPIGNNSGTNTGCGPFNYSEYDGQGHSITGLYDHNNYTDGKVGRERNMFAGLFGSIQNSTVHDIRLVDVDIELPNVNDVGALAGELAYQASRIYGVSVSGNSRVVARNSVGGIVGYAHGNTAISDCSNGAVVSGTNNVGGIVGSASNSGARISACYNDHMATVTATGGYAGGLVGSASDMTLTRSTNLADVTALTSGGYAGGLVGYATSGTIVSDCYSEGTITSESAAGGLSANFSGSGSDIHHCLFAGDVNCTSTNSSSFGLIVGYINGSTSASELYYSAASTLTYKGNTMEPTGCYYPSSRHFLEGSTAVTVLENGALAFKLQGLRDELVWGQDLSTDRVPKVHTTAHPTLPVYVHSGTVDCRLVPQGNMQYANTKGSEAVYLDHVFDPNGLCTVCGHGQEPALVGGFYQIANVGNFMWFRDFVNDKDNTVSAQLTADIDLSAVCGEEKGNFAPIKDFRGNFDGQGHKISGFYFDNNKEITKATHMGLFATAGHTGAATEICNLEVEGRLVSAAYDYAALLVGDARGKVAIHHITTRGSMAGRNYAGGIVGYLEGNATITQCTNYATITGSSYVGGIIGRRSCSTPSVMENMANYGDVTALDLVGGIIGYKEDNATLTMTNVANYGNISAGTTGVARAGGIMSKDGQTIIDGAYVSGNVFGARDAGVIMYGAADSYSITRAYYDASLTLTVAGSPVDISSSADSGNAIGVSHEDVVAGRAAYLLGEGWGQQLPGGTMPVIGGPRVYYGRYQHAVAEPIFPENRYTNIIVGETYSDHDFDMGFCTICGKTDGNIYDDSGFKNIDWKSDNQGIDNSESSKDYNLIAEEGDKLTLDWTVESERNYDKLYIELYPGNTSATPIKIVTAMSGSEKGTVDITFSASDATYKPGTYVLRLRYTKDSSTSSRTDTATAKGTFGSRKVVGTYGDVDGDDDFDVDDITTMRNMILESIAPNGQADLDGDGMISIGDVTEAIHQLIMP